MRNRTMLLTMLGLLPAVASAQRIPTRIPTRTPTGPTGLTPGEPEPAPVAQRLAYTRSRWSFEGTSVASIVQAPGFGGNAAPLARSWSLTGSDAHLEYRATSTWSPSLDFTGAMFGSTVSSPFLPNPVAASLFTMEPGVRKHFAPLGDRLTPFIDLRANYMLANGSYQSFALAGAGSAQQFVSGSQLSHGIGGVAGAGMDVVLFGPWSVTSEVSGIADRMSLTNSPAPASPNYWMHWYRLSLGIKYNRIIYSDLAQRALR